MAGSKDTDILISGAGFNGSVAALALARAGFSVFLVDRGTPKSTSPAKDKNPLIGVKALNFGAKQMLAVLGLWEGLANKAEPILEMKVSDMTAGIGSNGAGIAPFFLHFSKAQTEGAPLGFLVEDTALQTVLTKAVKKHPKIKILPNTEVIGYEIKTGHVEVSLAPTSGKKTNSTIKAKIIVGCDGRDSAIAELAGITRIGWDYRQSALVCTLACARPHHGIAHQIFTPSGPLAALPLTKARVGIVWTQEANRATEINALNDTHYLAALRGILGDYLGEVKLAGGRGLYPLSLSLASAFVAPRIALLGDSAHGIHPLAGQGLNLGFYDSAALAEVLFDARCNGEDIGNFNVLKKYQAWRRFDSVALALATDGLNKLFSNDAPVARGARGVGLGIVNALPFISKTFAQKGAGLGTETPRFTQGLDLI